MIEQGSAEWFALRLGKVTASRVADIVARTKSGPSASRANYAAQLVAERLSGAVEASYTNTAMQWGTDMEPEARVAYEFLTGNAVDPVDFIEHPHIAMSGASPDGLIGTVGLVEFKCPNTATHIETLLSDAIPTKHEAQMLWQLACSPGREWCDFVSFDPRMPEEMRMFRKRFPRDNGRIAALEDEVRGFLFEVDATVKALTRRFAERAAA